jgi:hypothetical protein
VPTTLLVEIAPSESSFIEYPDIRLTYPGRSGSTHGEMNEAAPANTAASSETSVTVR